jgi:hypothetical protein
MDPSAGVAEPQREFWLLTHRTDVGADLPPRYLAESCAACAASAASEEGRRPVPLERFSPWLRSFSSIR